MKKKSQHSQTLDFLINNLYDIDLSTYKHKGHVDPSSAKFLYSVWKDPDNQISNRIYKKPKTLNETDIESMKDQGLIKCIGDKIEITSKGSDIVKTMILGNDKSFFDKECDLDYITAEKNTNARQVKKQNDKYESSWWNRFFKENK